MHFQAGVLLSSGAATGISADAGAEVGLLGSLLLGAQPHFLVCFRQDLDARFIDVAQSISSSLVKKAQADRRAAEEATLARTTQFAAFEVRTCQFMAEYFALSNELFSANSAQAAFAVRPASRTGKNPADLLALVDAAIDRVPSGGGTDRTALRAYAVALKVELAAAEAFRDSSSAARAALDRLAELEKRADTRGAASSAGAPLPAR